MNEALWSPLVRTLVPYVPGEQPKLNNLVKLNTNEHPFPPSPRVAEAIAHVLADQGDVLKRYPDPESHALVDTIAQYYGVSSQQVFVGNGSDEVLAHAFVAFFKQDQPILFPDITYSFYQVYAQLFEVDFRTVALAEDLSINPQDYVQPCGGVIFPNPNAPTGRLLSLDAVEIVLKQNPQCVVIVDEAYIDFGGQSAIALVQRYPNLLVVQTASKSRALAGVRLGYAIGDAGLIAALQRVKNSFNSYPLDRMAQAAGIASFTDDAYFKQSCAEVMVLRDALVDQLKKRAFDVIPSAANFIFVTHTTLDAEKIALHLRNYGVIVRHFKHARIAQYLRITIGTASQHQQLLQALDVLLCP